MRRLLDNDRQREQRRQSGLLDKLSEKFEGRIRRELVSAANRLVASFENNGKVPSARAMEPSVRRLFEDMAKESVRTFGARVLQQGVEKAAPYITENGKVRFATARLDAPEWEAKDFAATFSRLAQTYIRQEAVRRRITSIADTTRQQIVNAVSAGFSEGLGVAETAKQVRSRVPTMTAFRAALIARTETHGAANFGASEAAKETGLRLRKEWVAAADERTRDDHAAADGQVVDESDPFDVGGEALMFPGDPAGSAAQVVNCRCAVSHIVIDD